MTKMNWHFPRLVLAKQVINMFESGLSTALVFFAPRRMGKTEFLLKDIIPMAGKEDWQVFYHSFLDASRDAQTEFTKSLQHFMQNNSLSKTVGKIKKIGGSAMGFEGSIELNHQAEPDVDFKDLLIKIARSSRLILLLDEIQTLVKNNEANLPFVTSLRTILDTHKDSIKVIFTGSSREGLRKMFSAKEAPFFHFGQNLSFPQFGPEFTEHLAKQYSVITQKTLNKTILWQAFEKLGKMPQLIRALVERIVLHPDLSIEQAEIELLEELSQDREFDNHWNNFSSLEQWILLEISLKNSKLYSNETRKKLAKKLGLDEALSVSSIQTIIRKLNKNGIIGHDSEQSEYFIDDPNFQDWIIKK